MIEFGEFSWQRLTIDFPVYITATATVILALVAYVQLRSQRQETASRAALDDIISANTKGDWMIVRDSFITLRNSGAYDNFGSKLNAYTQQDIDIIRKVLNRYELIAIGIDSGAFDEATYKRYIRSSLIHDFLSLKQFIQNIRYSTGNDAVYIEFEELARKWSKMGELEPESSTRRENFEDNNESLF